MKLQAVIGSGGQSYCYITGTLALENKWLTTTIPCLIPILQPGVSADDNSPFAPLKSKKSRKNIPLCTTLLLLFIQTFHINKKKSPKKI